MNRGADRGKRNEMPIRSEKAVHNLIVVILVSGIVVATVCIGLLCGVPPVSRDALTHHLYVPNLYVAAGEIVELPHIPFSYYPMNLDLLYAVPLLFGNDILPKYIHFLFALLTAWWLYRFTAKRYSRIYGLFGALFFLSVPIVIKLSATVYVDLGLVFFTTASLLGLARWRECGFPARTLICAGLFCGLAMGTKYNGLVSFALLTLMVPVVYLKGNPGVPYLQWKALWQGVLFATVALVVFSPWMIRNIVWTGNPLYPLYQNVFDPGPVEDSTSDPEQEDGESASPSKDTVRWTPFNIRSIIYGESKWQIASIPLRVFFEGKDDDPRHFDGVLSPFLLLFPLGLLLRRSGGRPMVPGMSGMFFLFSAFFLLVVFFKQDMRIRWILPIVPPLVILSVGGMHRIAHRLGIAWPGVAPFRHHLVVVAGMICVLGGSIPYVHDSFAKVKPFEYLTGKVGRDDYILRYRPEYAAIQYANRFVPASEKILAVYLGNRGYYFEKPVLFSNRFVEDFVAPFSRKEEIGERIRGEGVRFLLVNMAFLEKRASESLDGDHRRLLSGFFSTDVETVFFRSGHGLFRLRKE